MSTPPTTASAPLSGTPNTAQLAVTNASGSSKLSLTPPGSAPVIAGISQLILTAPSSGASQGVTNSSSSTSSLVSVTFSSTTLVQVDPEKSRRWGEDERARKKPVSGPLTFSDTASLVKLLVRKESDSDEKVEMIVHKQVACHRSPVLRAAFNGPFLEGQEQSYFLEGATQESAQFLVQWMYTEKLVVVQLQDDWVEEYQVDKDDPKFNGYIAADEVGDLMMLWILADTLQMPALQNYVIKTLVDIDDRCNKKDDVGCMMANEWYPLLYDETSEDSVLGNFFCDHLVAHVEPDQYPDFVQYIPNAMRGEVICILAKGKVKYADDLQAEDYYVVEQ